MNSIPLSPKVPGGGDIPLAMIRLNPLLLYDNTPVPMTISGWLTFYSSVTCATNDGLYGTHDTYPKKHWAGERNDNMGTKVKGDKVPGIPSLTRGDPVIPFVPTNPNKVA